MIKSIYHTNSIFSYATFVKIFNEILDNILFVKEMGLSAFQLIFVLTSSLSVKHHRLLLKDMTHLRLLIILRKYMIEIYSQNYKRRQ